MTPDGRAVRRFRVTAGMTRRRIGRQQSQEPHLRADVAPASHADGLDGARQTAVGAPRGDPEPVEPFDGAGALGGDDVGPNPAQVDGCGVGEVVADRCRDGVMGRIALPVLADDRDAPDAVKCRARCVRSAADFRRSTVGCGAARTPAGGRPIVQRLADLPVVPERIFDAPQPPPVRLSHRIDLRGARRHGPRHRGPGVIDDEQHSHGGPPERLRAVVAVRW
jgi:hypothetical protein